jgi:hypothetical protein
LAYSGIAMAARIPMMATTIISSMSVKPPCVLSVLRLELQKVVKMSPLVWYLEPQQPGHS